MLMAPDFVIWLNVTVHARKRLFITF